MTELTQPMEPVLNTAPSAPSAKGKKHSTQRYRTYKGEHVTNALYNGRAVGHGKYFAAMVNGVLLMDENGKPISTKSLPLTK